MIAPVNMLPPHPQLVDGEQTNQKNISVDLQQSHLDTPALQSPNLQASAKLRSTPKPQGVMRSVTLKPFLAPLSAAPTLVAEATTVKTLPVPEMPAPEVNTPVVPSTSEVPEVKQNLSQNDPQPLPPPSEVTPLPPVITSPQPTGRPPVEPSNYPNQQSPYVYYNQNYIGPAISFGNNTLIGAASRFGLGKNISIRPSLFLGNSTRIAVPVTYDFGFNNDEAFEKNPLVVFHAGGGLDYQSNNGSNGSQLNPLVVFGADVYLGDGASVLMQIGNAFNSEFKAVLGVGLQF